MMRRVFQVWTGIGVLAMIASQALIKWGPTTDYAGNWCGVLLFGGFMLVFSGISVLGLMKK